MSEEILDDGTRNDILRQVFASKPKPESQVNSPTSGEKIDEKTDFGTLLEKSIEKRLHLDAGEQEISDDVRKKILERANLNILKEWKF